MAYAASFPCAADLFCPNQRARGGEFCEEDIEISLARQVVNSRPVVEIGGAAETAGEIDVPVGIGIDERNGVD